MVPKYGISCLINFHEISTLDIAHHQTHFEAPSQQEEHTFVIDQKLIQGALVLITTLLHGRHQLLHKKQCECYRLLLSKIHVHLFDSQFASSLWFSVRHLHACAIIGPCSDMMSKPGALRANLVSSAEICNVMQWHAVIASWLQPDPLMKIVEMLRISLTYVKVPHSVSGNMLEQNCTMTALLATLLRNTPKVSGWPHSICL